MVWSLYTAGIILFTTTAGCNSTTLMPPHNTDTVVLCKKDSVVTIETTTVNLFTDCEWNFQKLRNKRIFLSLDDIELTPYPDGVYELYIADSRDSVKIFVSTLDVYSFSAPGASPQVRTDITEGLNKLLSSGKKREKIYFAIQFSGNIMPDGTPSTQAGKMKFSSYRILQARQR